MLLDHFVQGNREKEPALHVCVQIPFKETTIEYYLIDNFLLVILLVKQLPHVLFTSQVENNVPPHFEYGSLVF